MPGPADALLIDIGNTRIKWARLEHGALGHQSAAPHAEWTQATFVANVLQPGPPAQRALISNVSGPRMSALASAAIREAWRLEPQLVQSAAAAGGVRNGYANPAQLGVDRWLAMLGARALVPGSICVVSVGTAMTIDALAADGRHLGGVIVPGPSLMVESLLQSTGEIAHRARQGSTRDTLFADNTFGAVQQGADHALAALVERAVATMERELGIAPALVLSGGASARLQQLLAVPHREIADLVLRGLAVLAGEP